MKKWLLLGLNMEHSSLRLSVTLNTLQEKRLWKSTRNEKKDNEKEWDENIKKESEERSEK